MVALIWYMLCMYVILDLILVPSVPLFLALVGMALKKKLQQSLAQSLQNFTNRRLVIGFQSFLI